MLNKDKLNKDKKPIPAEAPKQEQSAPQELSDDELDKVAGGLGLVERIPTTSSPNSPPTLLPVALPTDLH